MRKVTRLTATIVTGFVIALVLTVGSALPSTAAVPALRPANSPVVIAQSAAAKTATRALARSASTNSSSSGTEAGRSTYGINPAPSSKISTGRTPAGPVLPKTKPSLTSNVVSGPDEFDVLSGSIGVDSFCPTPGASNGVPGWLCVQIYINQGWTTTYYADTFHWKLTDACGTVLIDRTDNQTVIYSGAGYYDWKTAFQFPANEPNQCDGTWSLTSTLSQQFPDGQTLSGTVTTAVTVLHDAPANVMASGQTYGGIPIHASQADPVDSYTGAFNDHMGSDISLAARGIPLQVQRSYSSNVVRSGPFGIGWTSNYDSALSVDTTTGNVIYHDSSGALQVFAPNGSGGYTAPPGVSSTLTANSGGGFTLGKWDLTQQVFNSTGQLIATKDRNGQGSIFTYTGSTLATVTGSGRSLTFTWDSTGTRIARVDGSDGRNVQYGYDPSLTLTSVTDPRGKVTTYGYDAAGHLNSIHDPNGNLPVRLVYDPTSGRVTQQQDANGATSNFSWNQTTQTATTIDPRGLSSQDVYMNGYLIQQTDGAGNTTRYTWDNNGRMIRITTPVGQTTTFVYDAGGNTIEKIAQDIVASFVSSPNREHYSYTSNNVLLGETDFNGNSTLYGYDAAWNVTSVTRPDVVAASGTIIGTLNTYNADGTLATTTDANNAVTHFAYNVFGDRAAVTTAAGRTTTYGYDSAGRLISTVSPRGNVAGANPATYTTTSTLNADGQITQTIAPLGITTSATYDAGGRQLTTTDPRGKTTTATYDADGHQTAAQGPDPSIAPEKYTYDVDGNVLTDTSPAGVVTTFSYNSINKKATAQTTGAGQYAYTYDKAGRLITEVFPSGHTTTYSWDPTGSLASVSTTDGMTTQATNYSSDPNGNRTGMTDSIAGTSYTYNALNQITRVVRGNNTWTYGYDNTGRTVSRTIPGSPQQKLKYDADGRLTQVTAINTANTVLASYVYNDTTGNTVTTLPGGVTQTSSADAAGRPTQVTGAIGSAVLTQSSYTLDQSGNPTAITDVSGTTDTYTYDASSRLTQVCYSTTTCGGSTNYISWTYNGDANRLTEKRPTGTSTYSYNSTGQLANSVGTSGTAAYSYDKDGHITSDGTNTYKWDLAGNMTSAGGSSPTTYAYDGEGRRVSITKGTNVVHPVWDPTTGQLNEETDGSGTTLRAYSYGTSLVGMTTSGVNYSYLTDAQGSVRAVVDSAGVAQWKYSFEPFGTTKSAVAGSRKAPTNTRQYLSALADGSSYDLSARQYVPGIGQFLSPDPAGNPGIGYQYGNGNPMSQIDPFGMSGSSWLKVAAGISSGTATTSDTANVNCTNGGWCSQLSTGRAPMAETVGAVSGTKSDLSISPASAKGSSSASVVKNALGGSASGGGLAYASKYKYQRHTLGPLLEIVVGITFIRDGGTNFLDASAATAAAPVTEGISLVPAAGLYVVGAADIVIGLGLSLDAVTRFTGQKPLFPLVDPLFNWG